MNIDNRYNYKLGSAATDMIKQVTDEEMQNLVRGRGMFMLALLLAFVVIYVTMPKTTYQTGDIA